MFKSKRPHTPTHQDLMDGIHKVLEEIKNMETELQRLQREMQETHVLMAEMNQRIKDLGQYMRDHAYDPKALTDMADALDADQADDVQTLLDNPVPGDEVPPVTPVQP